MAPKDYIAARQNQDQKDDPTNYHVILDDRPYYPFLTVDPNDHDSIRSAVAKLLENGASSSRWKVSVLAHVHEHKSWPVSVVSGGITNQLFRVEIPVIPNGNNTASVLVRIFGAEGMIDRDIENATYAALASLDLAPSYYGRFANGRLEGWLDGMRPLTPREMAQPKIASGIAKQLAAFHSKFRVPTDLQEYHNEASLSMWTQLYAWMDQAANATFQNDNDTERASKLKLEQIPKELKWLQDDIIPKDAQVAFCHNDALAANILYSPETNAIRLIDFEYGGMNYVAFDIANHFNEYAGGTDTGITRYQWFPSTEQQRAFLKIYLENATTTSTTTTTTTIASNSPDLEAFHQQVQAFILANHLYWGLWAVNQAAVEGCQDFDYLLYASNRLARYFDSKSKEYDSSSSSS